MIRYSENSPIVKAVRELEAKADELGLLLEYCPSGIVFHHKSSGTSAVYLDIDWEETTQFPHPFENKLMKLESYLHDG